MRNTTLRIGVTSVLAAVVAVFAAGCSDSRNALSGPTTVAPSDVTAPAPGPDTVVITINGENGADSFSPNPATVAVGQSVVWYNADGVVHRIVADDESFDTGDIEPGLASAPVVWTAASGAQYHCFDEPDMVGSVN